MMSLGEYFILVLRVSVGVILAIAGISVLAYFCTKFGTVGFYKGKEFIKRKENCNDNESNGERNLLKERTNGEETQKG